MLRLNRGLIFVHDRHIVANRVHSLAFSALEAALVFLQVQIAFTGRTTQYIYQNFIDGHADLILTMLQPQQNQRTCAVCKPVSVPPKRWQPFV
jgi:hypothetical protein